MHDEPPPLAEQSLELPRFGGRFRIWQNEARKSNGFNAGVPRPNSRRGDSQPGWPTAVRLISS